MAPLPLLLLVLLLVLLLAVAVVKKGESSTMNLGVQYYRAPFPQQKYWADDMARIKDSGLNTVQLWVLWSWVEAEVGRFRWDDYDRLMELADANGLGVVLSAIAEMHPYWIHREVPGSEMVTSMGHKVVSSNRGEVHFGITPGGCADHPGVWDRMANFLRAVTERYHQAPALRGWDAWNELRWNVQADGLVCYCPHTLRAFREWLGERYGGLDGLNAAWLRRYGCWEEVMPGKVPNRPYTEMMAFEHFLTDRACRHAKARYDVMRAVDTVHPVTVHGGAPSPLSPAAARRTRRSTAATTGSSPTSWTAWAAPASRSGRGSTTRTSACGSSSSSRPRATSWSGSARSRAADPPGAST